METEPTTALATRSGSNEILPGVEFQLAEPPSDVLAAARQAAIAIQDVISKKKSPVIFNGEQYLEFEDWQTLGRFYGVTAKIESVGPIELGASQGFHASAVAILGGKLEISRAEAFCMNDEKQWSAKPLFQLASMAQTRAGAKVLRNVLAWVAVLAGYKATPAEEMEAVIEAKSSKSSPAPPRAREPKPTDVIGAPLRRMLFEMAERAGLSREDFRALLLKLFPDSKGSTESLTFEQADRLKAAILEPDEIPF
jgi:hypothetical protein